MQKYNIKIGTQPMIVTLDKRYKIRKGNMIRFKLINHGEKWQNGIIDDIQTDTIFISKF